MNLKMTSIACCMALAAGAAVAGIGSLDQALKIKNVSFVQDLASRDVLVNYEVEGAPALIQADILTNGVSIGCAKTFSGDYSHSTNDVVAVGAHSLTWHARKDWPDNLVDNLKVRVKAYYPEEGAALFGDYMVIDLNTFVASYLYEAPAGGWTDEHKTTKLVLRKIPAGSVRNAANNYTIVQTRSYWMGVFETTEKQYALVMGTTCTDGKEKQAKRGVTYQALRGTSTGLSYPTSKAVDDSTFFGILRKKTGLAFDLPCEMQWEYACRAGTTSVYYNGTDTGYSGIVILDNNWNSPNVWIVGRASPNAWGLYDMLGNVSEICADVLPNWGAVSFSGQTLTDYEGETGKTGVNQSVVVRSGAWDNPGVYTSGSTTSSNGNCKGPAYGAATRYLDGASKRDNSIGQAGFRVYLPLQ